MNRRGNVLFLILIAVALFAALSYAVTQSSSSGGNDISDEQANLFVSEMVQYGSLIQQTIMRLRITNGCADDDISWHHADWPNAANYVNTRSPVDNSCHIFHPDGGGLSVKQPPEKASSAVAGLAGGGPIQTYFFDVRRHVQYVGLTGPYDSGTGNDVMIRAQVSQKVCSAINKKIRNTLDIPTDNWPYSHIGWDVLNTGAQTSLGSGSRCSECASQKVMCFNQINGDTDNIGQFYFVVMAR